MKVSIAKAINSGFFYREPYFLRLLADGGFWAFAEQMGWFSRRKMPNLRRFEGNGKNLVDLRNKIGENEDS